jgi:hypothetical protein
LTDSTVFAIKGLAKRVPQNVLHQAILSSSMAEHSAVNRRVVGSSPTSGANSINNLEQIRDS